MSLRLVPFAAALVLCAVLGTADASAADAGAEKSAPLSASPATVVLGATGDGSVALINQTGTGLALKLSVADERGRSLRTPRSPLGSRRCLREQRCR